MSTVTLLKTSAITAIQDAIHADAVAAAAAAATAEAVSGSGNGAYGGSTPITGITDITFESGFKPTSAIASRAPAQGIVSTGVAGSTWTGQAFGTSEFTQAAWFVWNGASTQTIFDGDDAPALSVISTGAVQVYSRKSSAEKKVTTAGDIVAGKMYLLVRTRNQLYLNGVALGASFTDTDDYTGACDILGGTIIPNQIWVGYLRPLILNRSLSAAEILALTERGAVDPSDISTISPQTKSPATLQANEGNSSVLDLSVSRAGQKIKVTPSWTGGGTATLKLCYGASNTQIVQQSFTSGTAYEITLTSSGFNTLVYFLKEGAGDLTSFTWSVAPLGALLAPDATQAGAGTTWRDVSGNNAHVTLGTGCGWALPSLFYREGLCALTLAAASGTITSYTLDAYYTRVGRVVTINGYIQIINNGTGAQSLVVSGLPFVSSFHASSGAREGGTHGCALSLTMSASSAQFSIFKYDNSYPVATGSNIPFTFTYMTDAP